MNTTPNPNEAARANANRRGERRSPRLPTFGGGGPLPGVDLDDSAALLDLMEGCAVESAAARG